jgi:hypothetical protein
MSSPKLGKRAYKINKPQCQPPIYHWVVNQGCFEIDNSETDEKKVDSSSQKTRTRKITKPYEKEDKNVDYLIEMLGSLYQKCKSNGITYNELQEHINKLKLEGKCRDCSVEDFQNLCKLKSSSNSFFDLVEKTQNLNIIRNFIDEYPECLSEKKPSQIKWRDTQRFDTPILYIYTELFSKTNKNNINDLVEYILLKYPEKCNLENRMFNNNALIHMIIDRKNNKLLKVLLDVGKRIGANKIGLDLMIEEGISGDDEFKTSTFKEFNITPFMQCFNTASSLKEFYSSILYMLNNFSSKELNLRGDNGNISTLLYIACRISVDNYTQYYKQLYTIISKILSFGAEKCYLNRAIPHIGTFISQIFYIEKSDYYPEFLSDLWKKLSDFSAEELNIGYVYDNNFYENNMTAFTNCLIKFSEENITIAEEMLDRYGDKLNFETIIYHDNHPSTVLQYYLIKYIVQIYNPNVIHRNKIIPAINILHRVILKLLNNYSEKCNIGFINKYAKSSGYYYYEYTTLELLLTIGIKQEKILPDYFDIVEKLISFGPKTLNFNHISPSNTYISFGGNNIYTLQTTNTVKLIKFCNIAKKLNTGDFRDLDNRIDNLLTECFSWDLADNLLDYPSLNNNWGTTPISSCISGKFTNAILNLLERGAEFNRLNNLYTIPLNNGSMEVTALIVAIIGELPEVVDRLLDFTNEEINLAYENNRGYSALSAVNDFVQRLEAGLNVNPIFIEIKTRIRQKLGLPEVEEEDEQDPQWFRQLPPDAQAQSVHQKAKVRKIDKDIKKLLKYPYMLELEEAAESFSKQIEGRIKPNDIYECKEKIYGFGDIHNQAVARALPEDKKVSACSLFQAIWSIIRNVKDKEVREEMTNRLEEEMSDCVKKGICSTGWATRLINTLGGYEDVVDKSLGEEEDEKEEKEIDAGWIIENYKNNYSKMLSEKMDELAGELSDEEYDEIMDEMTMNFEDQRKYKDIKLEIGQKFKEFVKNKEPNVKDEVLDEAIEELVKIN